MSAMLLGGLLDVGKEIIRRVIPDKEAAIKAEMDYARMLQSGEFKMLETRMSAIVAEANSSDPWTSRARPSFMYVMYIIILSAIPMGVLSAFEPGIAERIAAGFNAWLAAIPGDLYMLFGAGYLGYSVSRSNDKKSINDLKKQLGG